MKMIPNSTTLKVHLASPLPGELSKVGGDGKPLHPCMMNQRPSEKPAKSYYTLICALLISLGIAAYIQRDALLNPLAVNDDVRNQIYWMARLVDPSLFPHDYIATYFTQSSLVSPLLWGIYWLASHGLDPVRVGQFLPLILAPLTTYFVYRFSENYAGKRYGFLAAFSFNLIIWLSRNLAGGLARAFAYPMLFAFLFFLSKNNRIGLILTTWIASLIYPPILFLNAGIWLSSFFTSSKQTEIASNNSENNEIKPDKASFLVGIGGGLAILAYRFLVTPVSYALGPLANSTVAAHTPEFFEGGRVPIFHFFRQPIALHWPNLWVAELLARTPGLSRTLPLLGVLLIYWLFQKFLAPKIGALKVPKLAWRVLGSAIGLYVVAWFALFYLYVPERYLQLSIPVLYTFLLAGLLDVILRVISKVKTSDTLKTGFLITPLVLITLLFSWLWDENLLNPGIEMLTVCNYLKHTPKSTLIATTPGLADNIPLYARRSVLVSQEAYIPFHQGYFREMKMRLKDFLVAYYSTTPAPLIQFIQKYKVDYMMVNLQDYSLERTQKLSKKYYHSFSEPFYHQLTQNYKTQDFLLSHPNASCRVVQAGNYILIPTQAILKPGCLGNNPEPRNTGAVIETQPKLKNGASLPENPGV